MFDCPEPTHTSPTTTFFNVMVFLPDTDSSTGPPAFIGASSIFHLPLRSAVAVACRPPTLTVTCSPDPAQPQTATLASRWSTMLSPKIAGNFTSADAEATPVASRVSPVRTDRRFIMVDLLWSAVPPRRFFRRPTTRAPHGPV